jgi:hypothetical protein
VPAAPPGTRSHAVVLVSLAVTWTGRNPPASAFPPSPGAASATERYSASEIITTRSVDARASAARSTLESSSLAARLRSVPA